MQSAQVSRRYQIAAYLASSNLAFEEIGLEAGPSSAWLYQALVSVDLPVVCIDARHASAALKAQNVKTDKNDARGLAHPRRRSLYGAGTHIARSEFCDLYCSTRSLL